jgi:hypothetical protein
MDWQMEDALFMMRPGGVFIQMNILRIEIYVYA